MVVAVIVPFLNEARHLPDFLTSLAAQSRPPDQLLLVDDGSTDGSAEIARRFASGRAGVRVLLRPPRALDADRLAQASEFRAFTWAIERLDEPWDVVAKLDADLRLPAGFLSAMTSALEAEPGLGLVGSFLSEATSDGSVARLRIGHGHVHGATKFYRRQCWEDIAPVPPILGWDTIDEQTARLRGWDTRTISLAEGDPLHLRPRGSQDGALRAYRRWGECAWAIGEAPAHVLLWSLREVRAQPRLIGSLNYVWGWVSAAARGNPRASDEVRAAVRRHQLRRIRRRISGRG